MVRHSVLLCMLMDGVPERAAIAVATPALVNVPGDVHETVTPPGASTDRIRVLTDVTRVEVKQLDAHNVCLLITSRERDPIAVPG